MHIVMAALHFVKVLMVLAELMWIGTHVDRASEQCAKHSCTVSSRIRPWYGITRFGLDPGAQRIKGGFPPREVPVFTNPPMAVYRKAFVTSLWTRRVALQIAQARDVKIENVRWLAAKSRTRFGLGRMG